MSNFNLALNSLKLLDNDSSLLEHSLLHLITILMGMSHWDIMGKFITCRENFVLNCKRKLHELWSNGCNVAFQMQFNVEFTGQVKWIFLIYHINWIKIRKKNEYSNNIVCLYPEYKTRDVKQYHSPLQFHAKYLALLTNCNQNAKFYLIIQF